MKNFLFIVCCLLLTANCFAQAGMWTWMKGYSTSGSNGVFGTQGVADPANVPPAVYEGFNWRDKDDNLWLFGGLLQGTASENSSLWKYDISTGNWTWMKGPSAFNAPGVYGIKGIPSPNNYPGARSFGGDCWTDSSGNFWMYGSWGYTNGGMGLLSDLWKYDPATNEWTWMSGDSIGFQNPIYGTFQVPSPTSNPGGRAEFGAGWVDNANTFWLYSGQAGSGSFGDVWNYNPSTNEWAWMNGSNTTNAPQKYGASGVFDPQFTPGSRWTYAAWRDETGNGWIFGGIYSGQMADMWQYDITTNQWAWMTGSHFINDAGSSGAICVSSLNYHPSARTENRMTWVDKCGNFWMFSGTNYNDENYMWTYDRSNATWSFAKGTFGINKVPVYGTQGVADPLNDPGFRWGGYTWTDESGYLWLYGGIDIGGGYRNDLWKFLPDPSCSILFECYGSSVQFQASDKDLCEKFCTSFLDSSTNNPSSWLWLFPGGTPSSSTDQNPIDICYNTPGTYDVTLITTNSNGSDTLTLSNYINVYSTPAFPTITQNGYTLTSSPAASYQWQLNFTDIPGATNQSYTITQTGYYTVIIGDSNGCVNSATQYVLIDGISENQNDNAIAIYPNPSNGNFMIEWVNGLPSEKISIEVLNTLGQKVFSSEEEIFTPSFIKEISLKNISAGIYFLEIKSENIFLKKKIIISK